MKRPALAAFAVLLLTACDHPGTIVILSSRGPTGEEIPVAQTPITILPYDRDSVAAALAGRGAPRPDTLPLRVLFDSLRTAAAGTGRGTDRERIAARDRFRTLQDRLAPRLDSLRRLQQAWRRTVFGGYDTLTLALIHRIARDPFTDTTDARGTAAVRPKTGGRWWVTVSTWDPADPYAEWYWNVPLAGDTIRLSSANATRRTRF